MVNENKKILLIYAAIIGRVYATFDAQGDSHGC